MKNSFKSNLVILLILLLGFYSPTLANVTVKYDYSPTFTDVDQAYGEFFGNIEYLAHIGVIEGYDDGRLGLREYINRAEMMKVIIEALGQDPDEDQYINCFPDVQIAWYAKYVCFAKEKGWIDGHADGLFLPENKVTNAQAKKMIMNAFFEKEVDLQIGEVMLGAIKEMKDVDAEDWYAPYIALANSKILQTFNSTWARPHFYVTRGNALNLLFKAIMVSEQSWEVYHPYFRDLFFKANDLNHFIVEQSNCYELWPTFDVPYLWDYVRNIYGVNDHPTRNVDFYGTEGPNEFPYFDPGYFCPLKDGGMVFSNAITYDKQGVEKHVMRFNGEGKLLQDKSFKCEEDNRYESIFYDNREVIKAFKLEDIDPETFDLLGCDHGKDKHLVYYQYGASSKIVNDADAETFEVLGGAYAKDKNSIYFEGRKFEKADLETFRWIEGNYAKDKNIVYSGVNSITSSLGPADPSTFQVLSGNYSKDSNRVYYLSSSIPKGYEVVEITPDGFEVLGGEYARGNYGSYYRGEQLNAGLEPATFEILERGYAKDANQVFYEDRRLKNVDSATFDVFDFPYARDKNHVYQRWALIEGANPEGFKLLEPASTFSFSKDEDQVFIGYDEFIGDSSKFWEEHLEGFIFKGVDVETFESLGFGFYKDKNHVYKGISGFIIGEADASTFSLVDEYLPDPFGRDKNHAYCEGQIISDDPNFFDFASVTKDCPKPPPLMVPF